MVALRATEAKLKLPHAYYFQVKGKKYYILDLNKGEVRFKVHWNVYHVPDDIVRRALWGYGKVEEIYRDVWRGGGFEGVKTTTCNVRMALNGGVMVESLPHQLQITDGPYLVLPGRSPLCFGVDEQCTS